MTRNEVHLFHMEMEFPYMSNPKSPIIQPYNRNLHIYLSQSGVVDIVVHLYFGGYQSFIHLGPLSLLKEALGLVSYQVIFPKNLKDSVLRM